MACPYTETEDGHELQLQANYLSSFLLTNKLMPKLLSSRFNTSIVKISSSANKISDVRWDDPDFKDQSAYESRNAYGQSKTAAILFSKALNTRLASLRNSQQREIHSFVVHPGGVLTNLQKHIQTADLEKAKGKTRERLGKEIAEEFFRFQTLQQACATPLLAALDPSLPDREGFWLHDCKLSTESVHFNLRAKDSRNADRLWKLSEELIGEEFDIIDCVEPRMSSDEGGLR